MARFVRERFPDREAEILALYLRSQEFRALCHDFGVCIDEIERLNDLNELNEFKSESTNQRLEQFRELGSELEADIVEQLNAAFTKPGQVSPHRKEKHVRNNSEPS